MDYIEQESSLTYDDISLLPNQISEIEHRAECDTSVDFLGIKLDIPIIASPMNTVCGGYMASTLVKLGCLGIVHRFNTPENQIKEFNLYDDILSSKYMAAAVGINSQMEFERLKVLADAGVKIICIDIANGGSRMIERYIKVSQQTIDSYGLKIIAGNVASYETTKYLIEQGVDAIRVGIGNGCFTPDTLVKTSQGLLPIAEIKIGTKVFSHDGCLNKVINVIPSEKNEEILNINNEIKCTKNHKFYVLNKKYERDVNENNIHNYAEWIPAEKLTKDYFLIKLD